MKTLKKTLCLVLAVVMAVGVLVIPASAAEYDDFTDKETIKHEEAVKVLNALGILVGKEENAFDPQGTLKRSEAAKMIADAILTPELAANLSGATKFTDVPADAWYAPYVAYCAEKGIIQGRGNNKFDPDGTLTGYELLKLLLVATNVEGKYTGADWKNNVLLNASATGQHLDGLGSGFDYDAGISRDDAAQLVFNALRYQPGGATVVYTVVDKDKNVVLYSGTDPVTASAALGLSPSAELSSVVDYKTAVLGNVFGLQQSEHTGDYGRKNVRWTASWSGNKKTIDVNNEPKKVYDDPVQLNEIAADLGVDNTKDFVYINIYQDGINRGLTAADTTNHYPADTLIPINKDDVDPLGKNGCFIEVYAAGSHESKPVYDVIVVDTYVKVLAKKDIKKAVEATDTADAQPAYIVLRGEDTNEKGDDGGSLTFETADFVEGDVVLYTKSSTYNGDPKKGDVGVNDTEVVSAVRANSIVGTIERYNSTKEYVVIDGETYKLSGDANLDFNQGSLLIDTEHEKTFYLDNNNNIVYVKQGSVSNPDEKYVYVDAVIAKAASSTDGNDLFGTGSDKVAAQAQARIINIADGTKSVVDIAIVQDAKGKWRYAGTNGAATSDEVTNVNTADTDTTNDVWKGTTTFAPGIYRYSEVNGAYAIGDKVNTTSVKLKKNTALIGTDDKQKALYATNSTVVTLLTIKDDGSGAYVTTYVGYQNFPSDEFDSSIFTDYSAYVIKAPNGTVAQVIVHGPEDTSSKVNYAIYMGKGDHYSEGQAYRFFEGNEEVQYIVADKNSSRFSFTANNVYNLTVDEDGYISSSTLVTAAKTSAKVAMFDSSYVIVENDNNQYNLAENCVVVDTIYKNDSSISGYAEGELVGGETVTLYTDSNNKVVLIVITAAAETE